MLLAINKTIIFHIYLCLLCTACGFHLRSHNLDQLNHNIRIQAQAADKLNRTIKQQLNIIGVETVQQDANYQLIISNERFEKSVLSLSARTAKAEEYQLTYNVSYSFKHQTSGWLIPQRTLTLSQDLVFNEDSLSQSAEEIKLNQELSIRAAKYILNHIQLILAKP